MTSIAVETLAAPLRDPMLPRRAVIEAIRQETHDVGTFTLRLDQESEPYRFLPGQFNMLYLPAFGEAAISISSDAEEIGTIRHTIRFVGTVTTGLARLRAGAEIGIRGPYGTAWPIDQARGRDLVIVGGGIGLAPLRPVIYHVLRHRDDFRTVTLLYGARTPGDLLYTDAFETWKQAGIDVHVTVDRSENSWKGVVGVVPLLFYRIRIEPKETVILTCGPEVMMHFVAYEALARRVPRESVWLSLERNMKCAIGVCGHCQYGPLFVCRDGPVISFARMEPYFNREEY
jgi:NAD(P)H-flavin reductase